MHLNSKQLLLVIVTGFIAIGASIVSYAGPSFGTSLSDSFTDINKITNGLGLDELDDLTGINIFGDSSDVSNACKEIEQKLTGLEKTLDGLQEELQSAPTYLKSDLMKQINEVKGKISETKALFKECQDGGQQPSLPSKVTGLSATPVSTSQVDLTWNQNPTDESIQHYNVYRDTSPGFSRDDRHLISRPTITSFSDSNLNTGTTYYYKIAAVNRDGTGPASDEVSATTEDDNPGGVNPELIDLGYEKGEKETGYEWGAAQYQENPSDGESRLVQVDKTSMNPNNEGDPQGEFALKATVKKGDVATNPKDSNHNPQGNRAEVIHINQSAPRNDPYYNFQEGDDVWFHWYTLFPQGDYSPGDKRFYVWTQWHQKDDNACCDPVAGFTEKGSKLSMNVFGDTKWTDANDLDYNHWYEMLFHVKWSQNGNVGYMELWQDKNRVAMDKLDRNIHFKTLDVDGAAYMKQGLYRDAETTNDQTVYHDGMVVATCPDELNFNPITEKCKSTLPYS
ncbi:heparin lyase I family protein [Candidatus Nitrosocosmicus sp. R]